MNVKELKQVLSTVPDDAEVVYERIEDVYFTENGWEALKLKSDCWWERGEFEEILTPVGEDEDDGTTDWIEAYEAFYNKEENKLKITAHT